MADWGRLMRLKSWLFAFAICTPTTAHSQLDPRWLMGGNCYDPSRMVFPKGKQIRMAEAAFQRYVDLARTSKNLRSSFSILGNLGKNANNLRWVLDGKEQQPENATDPWINDSTTFKLIGMVRSKVGLSLRGEWQAFSADGHMLGTYDAFMIVHIGGFRLRWLRLYSQGKDLQPEPLTGFCMYPGDALDHQRDPKKDLLDQ